MVRGATHVAKYESADADTTITSTDQPDNPTDQLDEAKNK